MQQHFPFIEQYLFFLTFQDFMLLKYWNTRQYSDIILVI